MSTSPSLRLRQFTEGQNQYRVEAMLTGDGLAPLSATARFEFKLKQQDADDVRWYLEDRMLALRSRFEDALLYAEAALRTMRASAQALPRT